MKTNLFHKNRIFIFLPSVFIITAAILFLLFFHFPTTQAATQNVTNLNDSGAGSFRQALADAADGDTISFNESLSGTIALNSALQISTNNLIIDGNNIYINEGSAAAGSIDCIEIPATGVSLSNFIIDSCGNDGIKITGSSNSITGNTISDTGGDGISVSSSDGNTISENTIYSANGNGINLGGSSSNTISSNTIGGEGIGNGGSGISLADGSSSNTIEQNIISYNSSTGVYITSTTSIYNKITQNVITRQNPNILLENGGNENLSVPTVNSALVNSEELIITGTTPEENCSVEFFASTVENDAQVYIGGVLSNDTSFDTTLSGDYTSYQYLITSVTDSDNNTSGFAAVELEELEEDNTPPTISAPQVDGSYTSATVTWTTNEEANSVVEYGKTNKLPQTKSSANLVTEHSIILTDLDDNTKYFFQVRSTDASGNESISELETFVTEEYALVSSPKEGDVIYDNQVTFKGAEENGDNVKVNLLVDGEIQNDITRTDVNGSYDITSNKLSYDGHQGRTKLTNQDGDAKRSKLISFITASANTANGFRIYQDKSDRPLGESNVTHNQKPYFDGVAPAGTVRLYIDDQKKGEDTTTASKLNYKIELGADLSYGKHTARTKVFNNKGEQIWSSDEFNFVIYKPYSAVTVGEIVDNRYLIFYIPSGGFYEAFLDGQSIAQNTAENHASGTASIRLDLGNYRDNQKHQIRIESAKQDKMPRTKATTNITLTKPTVPRTPTPTPTPEQPEEEVQEPDLPSEDPLEEGSPDEDVVEEETEIIENNLEDIAEITPKPPAYPPLTSPETDLTSTEKIELQDSLAEDMTSKTKIDIILDDSTIPQEITPEGIQITVPKILDLTTIWQRLIGREAGRREGDLVFQGQIDIPEKLKGQKVFVVLTLYSDPIVRIAEADENGVWKISVPVNALPPGEHTAFLGTEVNGVQSEQVEIARLVIQEEEKLSNTTIFFLINVGIAIFALLLAIFLQLRKNRKNQQEPPAPPPVEPEQKQLFPQ